MKFLHFKPFSSFCIDLMSSVTYPEIWRSPYGEPASSYGNTASPAGDAGSP